MTDNPQHVNPGLDTTINPVVIDDSLREKKGPMTHPKQQRNDRILSGDFTIDDLISYIEDCAIEPKGTKSGFYLVPKSRIYVMKQQIRSRPVPSPQCPHLGVARVAYPDGDKNEWVCLDPLKQEQIKKAATAACEQLLDEVIQYWKTGDCIYPSDHPHHQNSNLCHMQDHCIICFMKQRIELLRTQEQP
jgi:hypothetical protein